MMQNVQILMFAVCQSVQAIMRSTGTVWTKHPAIMS